MKIKKLWVIFAAALLLRLSLIFIAYHGDLNNNISWATSAVEKGFNGFYERDNWDYSAPNQPPLTILMFAASRVAWQAVENLSWWLNNRIAIFPSPFIWFWEARGMILLVKLPSILADLGIGWLIYKYFYKRDKGNLGMKLAAVWLFNPITWYNSSIWGQTDSIVNLLGLLVTLGLLNKRLIWFSVFLTLSLLFKGSLAIFVPVLLLVAIFQKHSLKKWMQAAVSSLGVVVLVSIWFHSQLNLISWFISLYKDRILPGEIGYLTANAFNFWWLVDSGKVLDGTWFFGLPARVWGFLIAITGILGVGFWLAKRKLTDRRIFLSLAIISVLAFLFMTRIHPRYLYPFFPYATILLGFIPGLIIPYATLTITHLINLYYLFWAPSFAPLEALYEFPFFAKTISVINILIFFYLLRHFRKSKL
ncbi:MAG: hypothetical protein ACC618_02520 [Patescibacteria group bacterium]